jgi:hypothetical protein
MAKYFWGFLIFLGLLTIQDTQDFLVSVFNNKGYWYHSLSLFALEAIFISKFVNSLFPNNE